MAVRNTGNPYNAGVDSNNFPTLTAVSGTAGTADTTGTAEIFALGGNPTTGGLYVHDINAGSGTILAGTITRISTIGTLELGSMTNTGTNVNVVTGTINSATLVGGTLQAGTVNASLVSSNGTITQVTTVSNLTNGTIGLGTVVGANATAGTSTTNPVQIGGTTTTGTVYGMLVDTAGNPQVDVVSMPSGGTIAVNMLSGTLNVGTANVSLVSSNGTVTQVTTVSNLTNGSVNLLTGTVTRVSNVGTIESGTIRHDSFPVRTLTSYGTLGTTGVEVFGTILAAVGAGTRYYLHGLSMVVTSGTLSLGLMDGTSTNSNGAGVWGRGLFTPGGGMVRDYTTPLTSGTNGTLVYWMSGAGTGYFTAQYFVV